MRILVIGSGFIGSSIIQRLQSEGHEVLAFSRGKNNFINCQQIQGNIFDPNSLEACLSWQPHVIIQTAWVTVHKSYENDSQNLNYAKFTINLAKRILKSNVEHFIVLGSCAEYGSHGEPISAGITELNPSSFYGIQKVMAFNCTRELLRDSHVRFTWARVFQPYGPRQDTHRLIPYLVKSLRNDDEVHLIDSLSIHDWITTRDISAAISWTIKHRTPVEIDIGTTMGYTNKEVIEHMALLLNKPLKRMSVLGNSNTAPAKFLVSKTSPLFLTGWVPTDSLNSGLQWVLEA